MIDEKERAIYLAHDIPTARHPGVKRTIRHLERNRTTWLMMKEDVELYITRCLSCQKGNPRTGKSPGELQPTLVPPGPWSHIEWDLVGPITKLAGKNVILCITDLFSKAIKLKAVTMKITAKGVAQIFQD